MTITRAWRGKFHSGRGFDPLYLVWRALTSVRVAIYLLGLVALGALLGTVFPPLPGPMRGNVAATNAWLELKREMYGPFTEPLYRLGVFDVFRTAWFNGLLVLTLFAVAVCSANRFAPTWRSITRLQLRVPDTYFGRARHRAVREAAAAPEALVAALRRRRYLVRTQEEADGIRIYADRYRWAQLATFVSHLMRDRSNGQLLYSEVLNLHQAAPSPRLTVRDTEGRVLLDERLTLPLFSEAGPSKTPTTMIPNPAGEGRWLVTLRPDDDVWRMEILDLSGGQTRSQASLLMGESAEVNGLSVSFAGMGDAAWRTGAAATARNSSSCSTSFPSGVRRNRRCQRWRGGTANRPLQAVRSSSTLEE